MVNIVLAVGDLMHSGPIAVKEYPMDYRVPYFKRYCGYSYGTAEDVDRVPNFPTLRFACGNRFKTVDGVSCLVYDLDL